MHQQTNGECVEVAGLKCWLPEKPPDKEIDGYGLPLSKQVFTRIILPDWYKKGAREEKVIREDDPYYEDEKLAAFRKKMWEYRKNGYWFFLKGVATYLGPAHWFYLNACRYDHPENDGYPVFYVPQIKRFYFRQYCKEALWCLGYIIYGGRGFGKTSEEVAELLHDMTMRPRKRESLIQSKSEKDARSILIDKMAPVFNELWDFFKPIYNHNSKTETKLSFYRPSVKGKLAKDVTYDDDEELQNKIDYINSKVAACRGKTLANLFCDEIGVTDPSEVDVYLRHIKTNRDTVYRNDKKRGIVRCTTTVEEMEKGGKPFKRLVDGSRQTDRKTEEEFTETGLFQMLVPDYECTTAVGCVDEWGFIIKEKAIAYHDRERLLRKDKPEALWAYIREHPRWEHEVWRTMNKNCHFTAAILDDTFERLVSRPDKLPYIQGNFDWENNHPFTKVLWQPCQHDKKHFVHDPETGLEGCPSCRFFVAHIPDSKFQNLVEVLNDDFGGRRFKPKNQAKFGCGGDPFQNRIVVDDRKASKGAFYIRRKYDPLVDEPGTPRSLWKTNIPILEYINRPKDIFQFYDDVIKAIWFYGCEIFPETNKIELKYYLIDCGMADFLTIRPKGIVKADEDMRLRQKLDGGSTSVRPMISHYTDLIDYDVNENGDRYPFPRLLKSLREFDNSKTQEFDASVGWGYTLVGCQKIVKPPEVPLSVQYVRMYDQQGKEIS